MCGSCKESTEAGAFDSASVDLTVILSARSTGGHPPPGAGAGENTVGEPWGLSGPEFLGLYVVGYVISVVMVSGSEPWCPVPEHGGSELSRSMSTRRRTWRGGPVRVVNTAIARLTLSGRILLARDGKLTASAGSTGSGEVEALVIEALHDNGSQLAQVRKHPRIAAIGEQLRAADLLLDDARVQLCRLAVVLPFIVWLIGVMRALNGAVLHRPVSGLVALLVISALMTWAVGHTSWLAAEQCPSAEGRRALQVVRDDYETSKDRQVTDPCSRRRSWG
jgi:uncharacterized protein (TIGR04222 family)